MNGLHLEATLGDVVANNASGARVVRLAEAPGIAPLESEQFRGAPDPHCWFNIGYFRIYAERTRDALIELAPQHQEQFAARAAAYFKELDALERRLRS